MTIRKTIPIKPKITDESKAPLDNANPEIRNSDYVREPKDNIWLDEIWKPAYSDEASG